MWIDDNITKRSRNLKNDKSLICGQNLEGGEAVKTQEDCIPTSVSTAP